MRPSAVLFGFAAVGAASPYPQQIDYSQDVENAGGPAPVASVPMGEGAKTELVTYEATSVYEETKAQITAKPLPQKKRELEARTACASQPAGAGPVPSPDTPEAFLAFDEIAATATAAATPDGYLKTFTNLAASNNANGYMGYKSMDSYDVNDCAATCNNAKGCWAFNVFEPGDGCENPDSTTVIKCVLWGGPVDVTNAKNDGQWRANFHVVIAGSNGYVKQDAPAIDGYEGTYLNDAAINAPLDCNGDDTYMGYKLFNDGQPFDPARCSAACDAQTAYNVAHPPSTGEPKICRYFNTYILNKNGDSQGQYCSMYTESWDSSYATNSGQYRGDDHYTISLSYTYSNATDVYSPVCPADVSYLNSEGGDFCTSYISYAEPTSTVYDVATVSTLSTFLTTTVATEVSTVTTTAVETSWTTIEGTRHMKRQTADATADASDAAYTTDPTAGLQILADVSIVSSVANGTSTFAKRDAIATPTSIATWPASKISSACSMIATGTSTTTIFTSTATVYTSTETDLATTTATVLTTATQTQTVAATTSLATCPLQRQASCFTITGHGPSWIEGKTLGVQQGYASPQFSYPTVGIFYLDASGYMYLANFDWIMATDRTGGGAWMQFSGRSYVDQYNIPKATCTKSGVSGSGTLTCFQTSTDVLTVWSYTSDSRSTTPMFGYPDSSFRAMTMTWTETTCPC